MALRTLRRAQEQRNKRREEEEEPEEEEEEEAPRVKNAGIGGAFDLLAEDDVDGGEEEEEGEQVRGNVDAAVQAIHRRLTNATVNKSRRCFSH